MEGLTDYTYFVTPTFLYIFCQGLELTYLETSSLIKLSMVHDEWTVIRSTTCIL